MDRSDIHVLEVNSDDNKIRKISACSLLANWGKRSSSDETSTRYIRLDLNDNDNDEARPVPAAREDDILKEFRTVRIC